MPTSNPPLKQSECTPLFNAAYKLRRAGAVLHSHSLNAMLVTKIFGTEFQIQNHEMIKGFPNHKNTDWLIVPIIENTQNECELTSNLSSAIMAYPQSNAVLVRNHGVYVWGETWQKAKIYAECLDYLFCATLEIKKLNLEIPTKLSSGKEIRAWHIDDKSEEQDIRKSLHFKNYKWVGKDDLEKIGVLHWKLDGTENDEQLDQICKKREYNQRDYVKCGNMCENYQEMLDKFKQEHLHTDEEIRYILDGSGYFDVRDQNDQWIRIQCLKGDFIILPEGIYHRFTTDQNDYIHAIRIFTSEPKWTPYSRPCDQMECRQKYLQCYQLKQQ
ncbi:hypothetical protein IMG5_197300 [Ichthyophthirius multifiliis]|uniref:Acireductone dioxygenase n=1 Tax=Ichthyophthirius multifiliis TaxID=5932 RepID=G0R5A0_ICHMU|nr:hypothetical protein IMG5_197300 [Ichthyophthirius multifiliis]EGR27345.1 hypothetical protein IMG5_197300 [Ichthyophthirius multifiliis]|eukprot:XP_004024229.1 hypothetical protein IMG5_197300 [Ichthyophthirius multifiliis]